MKGSTHTSGHVVHVLVAPVDGTKTVQKILSEASGPVTVLDLSAGYVSSTSCLEHEMTHLLMGANVEWIDGHDYATELADIARSTQVNWLAELANTPLQPGGPTLKEVFIYRTRFGHALSMWWLTEASKRHPISSSLSWVVYALAVVGQLVQERSGRWVVWSDDPATRDAIVSKVRRSGSSAVPAPALRGERASIVQRLVRTASGVVGNVLHIVRSTRAFGSATGKSTTERCAPRILIQTLWPEYWVRTEAKDPRPAPTAFAYDLYFGDLPWRLRDNGYSVAWMPAAHPGTLREWEALMEQQDIPDVREGFSFTVRDGMRLLTSSFRWIGQYMWWFHVRRVHRRWTLDEAPLGEWIRRTYAEGIFRRFVPRAVLLDIQSSAIHWWQPDVVLHKNDFLHDGRILAAAAACTAPAVAVQHGLLNQHVGIYQYASSEIGPFDAEPPDHVHYCPVPDRVAGFGDYTRDYFAQWKGYPASRIDAVGGVRHDWLVQHYLHGDITREEWRSRLGIPSDAKVILLCTTYATDVDPWLSHVVEGAKQIGLDAFLAIKLHHGEGGVEEARATARRLGLERYAIFEDRFYELLSATDVMISGASTTVLEAALFGVPVFSFTAGGYETFPFESEGLSRQGQGGDDVARWLKQAFQDDSRPDEALVRRHLWNADAAAHRRLVRFLRNANLLPVW